MTDQEKTPTASVVIGGAPKLTSNTDWGKITPKKGWNPAKHQIHHPIGKTK